MNRTDDGYDVEPEVVEGFEPSEFTTSSADFSYIMQVGGAIVGGLIILFLVYKASKNLGKPVAPVRNAKRNQKKNR